MTTHTNLRRLLRQIDQQSYKAYKDLKGQYEFSEFVLFIDRVQGDPFASPSQCRVRMPQSRANFPPALFSNPSRAIALRDYLTRQFDRVAQTLRQRRGSGSSGLIAITQPGQTILDRTAAFVSETAVEIRFVVGLPAFGRRVAGIQAAEMLCDDLPELVDRALKYSALDARALQRHVETAEDADWIRDHLAEQNLVAFIADGAILPRQSGVDERPLKQESIPFQAPESLRVEFICPNRGKITGMGIPTGVTLIVGGGYHGKSTLLRAIELGVYNHIPGDGREYVITNPAAVKIRAEDGRSIARVDISPFINHLPQGRSTTQFSTQNASGSTSQAANIVEALEAGAKVLLVDEDTAATNFMIRDRRMQALIAKDKEPITPFIDKVRQLYTDYGVSTILVMGGSGDYFDVADTVIAMQDFQPQDVTAQAKAIAQQYATDRAPEGGQQFGSLTPRILKLGDPPSEADRPPKRKVRDLDTIVLGQEEIDLSAVEQIVETAQLRAIAATMLYLQQHHLNGQQTLPDVLDRVIATIQTKGFDALTFLPEGDFALFRRFELAAAINRWRSLQ
ncbi:ABC-ATPase domain-containing protein [Leptothermofonsia sp. ETS-13]|uniref:ABC-ATPase domain-containing protein n=1 Tax=Leptothermofonsia sp. ETS-13 TaxID=3035696 RepID=UPI003B9FE6A8